MVDKQIIRLFSSCNIKTFLQSSFFSNRNQRKESQNSSQQYHSPLISLTMSLTRRPHSAMATTTHYDLSTKQYRVPEPQCYNKLKNDIYKTFSLHTSATYNDIMQLTGDQYHKRIDRLCSKYCIKPQGKNSLTSTNVDSEFIARNFVRSKSRQRQGTEMRNYMQVEVRKLEKEVRVSKRKREGEEFFKLTTANLKRLQAKEAKVLEDQGRKKTVYRGPNRKGSAKSKSKSRYDQDDQVHQQPKTQRHSHPYLKIYQQSQQQALHSILNHNNIALSYEGRYPHLPEADQLQKYQKQVKGIYSGIKRLRYAHSAREVAKTSRSSFQADRVVQDGPVNKESFYIT